jgi:hypothetical protein
LRRPTCHQILLGSLVVAILLVVVVATLAIVGPELYYASSAPIVTPQYSAEELWKNPLPTPGVINELWTEPGQALGYKRALCVGIWTYALWEQNERDVYLAVQDTTGITVDGQIISRRDMNIGMLTILIFRRDEQGNEIGSHGGDIHTCFEIPQLSPSLHVATIRFESNAGTPYIHEWAFRVE